jgi:hypothetical protein
MMSSYAVINQNHFRGGIHNGSDQIKRRDVGSANRFHGYPGPEESVRQRAFEMYQERGMEDGQAEQDWYRAENKIKPALAEPSALPE